MRLKIDNPSRLRKAVLFANMGMTARNIGILLSIRERMVFKILKIGGFSREEYRKKIREAKRREKLLRDRTDPRLPTILKLFEEGNSYSKIARILSEAGKKITRKDVGRILNRHGIYLEKDAHSPRKDYQRFTSDEIEAQERALKRQAFSAGLTVAELIEMKRKIGRHRFAHLREIMMLAEKNARRLKTKPEEKIFQMSALELFLVYLQGRDTYCPEKSALEAFDYFTKPHSSFVVARIDWSKPYLPGNVELITMTEFGKRLGERHIPSRIYTRHKKKNNNAVPNEAA